MKAETMHTGCVSQKKKHQTKQFKICAESLRHPLLIAEYVRRLGWYREFMGCNKLELKE